MTTPRARLLIIDDDPRVIGSVTALFSGAGFEVGSTTNPLEASVLYRAQSPDVVILDVAMEPVDGFGVLDALLAEDPHACVLMLTGNGDIDSAVRAMRGGAEHFLTKPFEPEHLLLAVERALTHVNVVRQHRVTQAHAGTDHVLVEALLTPGVLRLLQILAKQRQSICVQGEAGTAKGVAATLLHRLGVSGDQPLLEYRISADRIGDAEHALFGSRAEDSSAGNVSRGLVTLARRGAVLVRGVEHVDLPLQQRLVREFGDAGRTAPSAHRQTSGASRARLLCTSRRPLRIGDDVYSREFVHLFGLLPVEIPALRDRSRPQLALLVNKLLADSFVSTGVGAAVCDDDAIDVIASHTWPRNVPELQDVLATAVARAPFRESLRADDVRMALADEPAPRTAASDVRLRTLLEVEREHVYGVMQATKGNIAEAARILGITRTTLYKKLRELDPQY